jgi:L-seryl-tRNA(Ser) seleniumtransferase
MRDSRRRLPSVDRILTHDDVGALLGSAGRVLVTDITRAVLDEVRARTRDDVPVPSDDEIAGRIARRVTDFMAPSLRPVYNLSGTVLHTNLGRAPLPETAIDAMTAVARGASNLEYDTGTGHRGDRDVHLEQWLCRLTGAEAATAVNNNAAAVLLVLNTLALRKEVPVSRGELIEIGGAFRLPDIMARAGAKLVEVGTTNRTHERDFTAAISPRTAALMKVHTSNYKVEGFTAAVGEPVLATLAHAHDLPFIVDLGSGTVAHLEDYGLPHEPTAAETIAAGADVVTFSGDKLLGGPQAGIIVGRADLIARVKKNPLKRALRLDKTTKKLVNELPSVKLLARRRDDIAAQTRRLIPAFAKALGQTASVSEITCASQIGSGALPVESLPSAGIQITPAGPKKARGRRVRDIAAAFRALPIPVIGRVTKDALQFDLRCLEDETGFVAQLEELDIKA